MHRQPTSSKHIRVESIRNWNGRTQNSGGEMSDFVDVLRQSIEKLIDEKQQLTKERDEARREVCDLMNMDWIGCVEKGTKKPPSPVDGTATSRRHHDQRQHHHSRNVGQSE